MKASTLILVSLVGLAAYLFAKGRGFQISTPLINSTPTSNQTGGSQATANQDLFTQIAGAANGILTAYNNSSNKAQTAPKSL